MTTRVGRYRVEVRGLHPTLAGFTAGARGPQERGVYCFWTAVLKRRVRGATSCTVRARVLLPPGERFERMAREQRTARRAAARRTYAFWWNQAFERGAGIAYIRPATMRETEWWMRTHRPDSAHAVSLQVGPPRVTAPTPAPPPDPVEPAASAPEPATEPAPPVRWRRIWPRIWPWD